MELFDDTGQARDAAILGATLADSPVKVDTAMKAAAGEYHGLGGRLWWDKVKALASRA